MKKAVCLIGVLFLLAAAVYDVLKSTDKKSFTPLVKNVEFKIPENDFKSIEKNTGSGIFEKNKYHLNILMNIPHITNASMLDIRASGRVPSLKEAMAKNKSGKLKKLVKDFISTRTPEEKRLELVDKILEIWANAENTDINSRGQYINAKHLVILEKFSDKDFYSTWEAEHGGKTPQNPNLKAGAILESLYSELAAYIYSELAAQSLVKDLYLKLNAPSRYYYIDYSPVVEALKNEIKKNPKKGKLRAVQFARSVNTFHLGGNFNNIPNKNSFYNVFTSDDRETKWLIDSFGKVPYKLGDNSALQADEAIRAADNEPLVNFHSMYGDDVVYGSNLDDNYATGTGDDILDGGDGNDTLDGGSGCNKFFGGKGNDTIIGGKKCDMIFAGEGDDTLILEYENDGRENHSINHIFGEAGNDNISSKYTNDWYYFYPQDGNDVIEDIGGSDVLIFPEGIRWDDFIFERANNDLLIKFKNLSDSIQIKNWFKSDEYKIERFNIPNDEPISKNSTEIYIKS